MSVSRRWLAAAVTILVATVVVGTMVRPSARAARVPHGGVAPVLSSTLVCPSLTGSPSGLASAMTVAHVTAGPAPKVRYAALTPGPGAGHTASVVPAPTAVVRKTEPFGTVALTATGPGADGIVASQSSLGPTGLGRGLTGAACLPPATDWWFVGPDGRVGVTDLLVLANPSDADANVALSLWSDHGPLNPPSTNGIPVAAHSVLVRHVSDFAPDAAGLALHVHANSGTVAAGIIDTHTSGIRPVGIDWVAPTSPPAGSAVVTGFNSGATLNLLELANPGDRDATVALRVVTPTKNFVPAGHQSVVVPAGRTLTVDLSEAIAGETAAVTLTSDNAVAAEGLTLERPATGYSDLAWLPAQQPLTVPAGLANNTPPFGQRVTLVLTAPEGQAKVKVATTSGAGATVTVPAGRTIAVDLKSLLHTDQAGPGALLLTSESDAPVYAIRTLYALGAHGPLFTAEAPTALPRSTALPPVVADLRAGTP